jgi:hypothetical protein
VGDAIVAAAQAEGYSVAAVDAPFSGALVPLTYYRKDRRIMSVMTEANRRLTFSKAPRLTAIREWPIGSRG